MELSFVYETLLADPSTAFVQTVEGTLRTLEDELMKSKGFYLTHVYPGSFNPLHAGHEAIYEQMKGYEERRFYELSLQRFDKPTLSLKELEQRLSQFKGKGTVIITNVSRFVDKAGVLRTCPSVVFHVGVDTLGRILKHGGRNELQGIRASFRVYDRIVDGKPVSVDDVCNGKLPLNVLPGNPLSEEHMKMSSTEIRNSRQS